MDESFYILLPLLIALPFVILIVLYHLKKDNDLTTDNYKQEETTLNIDTKHQKIVSTSECNRQSKPSTPRVEQNLERFILEYEKLIKDFKYEKYQLEKHEFVYNIENSVIVFVGIDHCKNFDWLSKRHVLVEELTENKLFKFVASHFHYIFKSHMSDFRVAKFYGLKDKKQLETKSATKFFYVNEKLPQLDLLNRLQSWKGVLHHIVIIELQHEEKFFYNVTFSTSDDVEKFAYNYCREIENYRKKKYPKNFVNNDTFYETLEKIYNEFTKNNNANFWTLRGKLKYFYITKNITDFDFEKELQTVYKSLDLGEYNHLEKFEYGRFDGKWKSELLVYEHCKKIFGENNVFYQYSPDFLGKLSYDVYIAPKNIAIEYQGKQHFEPVEFFGGQEHFEQQIKRDKLKKRLSKENGINLIYINYDEVISSELILKKIKQSQNKTSLGHSDITVTSNIYVHENPNDLAKQLFGDEADF